MSGEILLKESLIRRPITSIIFDFDGVLADSEDLWFRASQAACAHYGMSLEESHRQAMLGTGSLSAHLIHLFSLSIRPEVITKIIKQHFQSLSAQGVEPMPGAIDLVKKVAGQYKLAIGSSAPADYIEDTLQRFGIRDAFSAIIGGNHIPKERRKPEPDVYLLAAATLGVNPHECLVFEDALGGVQAAKSAGMRCIAVPHDYLKDSRFSIADAIVPSLLTVQESELRGWEWQKFTSAN